MPWTKYGTRLSAEEVLFHGKLCNLESHDSEFTWCWKLGTSAVGFSSFAICSLLTQSSHGVGSWELVLWVWGWVPFSAQFQVPRLLVLNPAQKKNYGLSLQTGTGPRTRNSLQLELDPDPSLKTHFVQVPVLQCFLNYLFLFFPSRVQQVF
jgi:hypothetical protein